METGIHQAEIPDTVNSIYSQNGWEIKWEECVGKRFGFLVVLELFRDEKKRRRCRCRCDCGNVCDVLFINLKNGGTRSCGCGLANSGEKYRDITNQRFGHAVALRPTEERDETSCVVWECRCDCGKIFRASLKDLTRMKVKSCGCEKYTNKYQNFVDIKGKTFGRLTVLEKTGERTKGGAVIWKCRCACGNETTASQDQLASGQKVSCGCKKAENVYDAYKALEFIDGTCATWLKERKHRCDNSSGRQGVYFFKRSGKYKAGISLCGTRYHLGTYRTFEEAVEARRAGEYFLHYAFLKEYEGWKEKAENDPKWMNDNPFHFELPSKEKLLKHVKSDSVPEDFSL